MCFRRNEGQGSVGVILQNPVEAMNKRRFASVALLSIILPISLLAAFRLTGVLREPPKLETITVEAVTWNMSRPGGTITVNEWVRNFFTDGIVSVGSNVHIGGYSENSPDFPSWGGDYLTLTITSSADVSNGFIYSMIVKFSRPDTLAKVNIEEHPTSMELHNLEIKKISALGTNNREAYFETGALNQLENASLSIFSWWAFFDTNDINHSVTLSFETIYFNGTFYEKVIQPIQLQITPDNNDSFETAQEIHEGAHPKLFIGPPDVGDVKDYYKITTSQGQRIRTNCGMAA